MSFLDKFNDIEIPKNQQSKIDNYSVQDEYNKRDYILKIFHDADKLQAKMSASICDILNKNRKESHKNEKCSK